MTASEFEGILDAAVAQLNEDVRTDSQYRGPDAFQERVLAVLKQTAGNRVEVERAWHRHAFPDICANGFGVEVKSTKKDSWLSVGNSVFEGMRDPKVSDIYVVFGKMGGMPAVKWGRYDERVTHVRISHAPRFVLEMDRDSSLFGKMSISYNDFCVLTPEEKMKHVRDYSRGRLKEGERLWWLEDEDSQGMEIEVKLYMTLKQAEKKQLRAEGAVLFPQIVSSGRSRYKYNDVAFYMLKYRNVFCPQTRDLYSAGSVAGKERGGNYLQRALLNIEPEMLVALRELPGELFEEYWGEDVSADQRIAEWLRRADDYAKSWKPSDTLFRSL